MPETTLIKSYGLATRLLGPFTPLILSHRASRGKEDPARKQERHGKTKQPRPDGQIIWCHGASIGECTMLLPLVNCILTDRPKAHVLVTSGTLTSAQIMAERLPGHTIHQYIPLDYPSAVKRFLKHWQPDLAIWAESEIWPNLLLYTRERGIPMALVNARMSRNSIANWQKCGYRNAQSLFGRFDVILAADEETANGLTRLLGKKVETPGNFKYAASALPVRTDDLKRLESQTTGRKIWCAASTHKSEDELMIAAHEALLKQHDEALLILAPRHPERRGTVGKLLEQAELSYVSRSSRKSVTRETRVLLFDTIGEMGLAYRLSHVSVVCGSFVKGLSGHNPLEPARLNSTVLTGPYISGFGETYTHMMQLDAAERLLIPEQIAPKLIEFFSDPQTLKDAQARSLDFAESHNAILGRVWEQIKPLLSPNRSQGVPS
ncbi:MAG: 3-deoxy-D-manno-octulosonic acid transferase [Hyphomonadaceae bacterium]|nr:3-deoxy-D-manno-octulosonic acid transferase [Hyphomonadaceae bacterium]MBC6412652.1 3-deoxy-D-manno-octulosonic acid transferase [Hyphomonadaceae bacterium]